MDLLEAVLVGVRIEVLFEPLLQYTPVSLAVFLDEGERESQMKMEQES